MKRIICMLLSVCMLLCLAACVGDHEPTTGTTKPVAPTGSTDPTKSQTQETTESTPTSDTTQATEATLPIEDLEDPSLLIFRQAMVETPQLFAAAFFGYVPQALENTHRIAERCNVEIEFGVTKLPKYEVPEGFDSWTYLQYLCKNGFAERYPDGGKDLEERLEYELNTIKNM